MIVPNGNLNDILINYDYNKGYLIRVAHFIGDFRQFKRHESFHENARQ